MMCASTLKYFEIPITSLEQQVTWTLGKVQVRPISPVSAAIFSGYIYTAEVRPFMHLVKTAKYHSLEKSRFLPICKIHINGLTSAIKTNRSKLRFFRKKFP